MTEKYTSLANNRNILQPVKRMTTDSDGNFILEEIAPVDGSESVFVQPESYDGEHLAQDVESYEDADGYGSTPLEGSALEARSEDTVRGAKTRKQKEYKDRAPLSVRDRAYRAVGIGTLAILGWTGAAGVSNYAATKVRYGVDIGYRQQLDNVTDLPDRIDRDVERAKKAMDFINIFNIKEVTGGRDD